MADTTLASVNDQIQTYWSPVFTKQLREALLLGSFVNKEYEGEIKKGGDTVTVTQINAPQGELLDVGTNADSFNPEELSTSKIDIKADKRAVASYKFHDLVSIQSLIDFNDPEVENSLKFAMARQINDYLYSLVNPSAATPNHIIAVADMNSAAIAAMRVLAGQAQWNHEKPWVSLLDPVYYGDVMDDTTMNSTDHGATDAPVISGQIAQPRYGFNIYEDNSRAADNGIFFHPDFLHLVMQTQVTTKVSDLHGNLQFGNVMSVDIVFGAKQGIDGDKKVIKATA